MKKTLKISLLFLFSLIILGLSKSVQANSIKSINMDIFINKDGTANITETWDCKITKGSECCHPYYNLGNSTLKNLTVTDNGKKYATISNWDLVDDLSTKSEKCCINNISNGEEICWGVTSYGSHEYVLKYDIENFVSEINDAQIIYWTFIPYEFSHIIGNVEIKIYSDFSIGNTIDVWGYGKYGGLTYVDDGSIYMKSDGKVKASEYMTILAKFPSNTFNTTNIIDENFKSYLKKAEKRSQRYDGKNYNMKLIITIVIIVLGIILFYKWIVWSYTEDRKRFKVDKKVFPKKVKQFKEIPCSGDIFKIYYIAQQYRIARKDSNIIGAIILKWVKDGIIKIEKRVNEIDAKIDNNVIILENKDDARTRLTYDLERILYFNMYEASKDGALEIKDFELWCKQFNSRMINWFEVVENAERDKLFKEGLVTSHVVGVRTKYRATQALNDKAKKIAGFKKFLLEHTLINDREKMGVELFEQYLIIAQVFGISEKIQKQFKELYPNMIEESSFNSYNNLIYANNCAKRVVRSIKNGVKSAARRRALNDKSRRR